jgi:phenylalanyl-tRNA synthetase alpha chain
METAPSADEVMRALDTIETGIRAKLATAATEQELRYERAQALGPEGALKKLMGVMGKVPNEQKKTLGQRANLVKGNIEIDFTHRLRALFDAQRRAELSARPFDLTMPARTPAPLGHKHPLSIVREEIVDVFRGMGFAVHDGPEVELEENNFTKLGFPPDHPATDMQDSFWTTDGQLLRTHTSNVQIRAMSSKKPPFAFIAPGAVYRRDDDATHSPMFHQLEAFLVDREVSMAHLRGVLGEFAERFFGAGSPVRWRPSYFPFVEPGAEVDVACARCRKPDGTRAGCNVCKHTGWVEILGCGMIHPVVFEQCGIDPEEWTGFALGMGIERMAMVRYDLPDLRLFFENDPRFLAQF